MSIFGGVQLAQGAGGMKYIGVDSNGIYVIKDYLVYINETKFNSNILDLLNEKRWDIHSPASLHDSKIMNINFNIDWKGDGYSIELNLIGPMNDRIFKLSYFGVTESSFSNITRYGDLFIHELHIDKGIYIHHLEFDDASLLIKASSVKFEEKIITR